MQLETPALFVPSRLLTSVDFKATVLKSVGLPQADHADIFIF